MIKGQRCFNIGLKEQIQVKFRDIQWPEVTLAKLEAYMQGRQTMDEYVTNFDNLKIKAAIIDDYTKKILSKNVWCEFYKMVIL